MADFHFSLRSFREDKLHLTQAELADLLGVRQDSISRMEKKPDQITFPVMIKLAQLSGLTLDQLIGYEPPKADALEVNRTWSSGYYSAAIRKRLDDYIRNHPDLHQENKQRLADFDHILMRSELKPLIAVAGAVSSGKSTLINSVLGNRLIPTSVTNSVPVPIIVKHIEDRPSSFHSSAYLFKGSVNDIRFNLLNKDRDILSDGVLYYGNIDDIASKLSSINDPQRYSNLYIVVIFSESQILRNCDLVEIPAQSLESSPFSFNNISLIHPDVLVYLFSDMSAIQNTDVLWFKATLELLREITQLDQDPFSNLFILLSKAHLVGSTEKADALVDKLCERLSEQVTSVNSLKSHSYIYAMDSVEWHASFDIAFRKTVESLPEIISSENERTIKEYCQTVIKQLEKSSNQVKSLVSNPTTYEERLNYLVQNESSRWKNVMTKRDETEDAIKDLKSKCLKSFEEDYGRILSAQGVSTRLSDNVNRYSQSQIQKIALSLSSDLEESMKINLNRSLTQVGNSIDSYLSVFESETRNSGFSAHRAFIKSAQCSDFAPVLTNWVSNYDVDIISVDPDLLFSAQRSLRKFLEEGETLAVTETYENKRLSTLTALGSSIPILGAGLALGALSIGAGIGAAVAGVAAGSSLLSSKKVCSKIVSVYSSERVLQKYNACIERIMNDVLSAFQQSSEKLETAWSDHLVYLKENSTRDGDKLSDLITESNELKSLFESLPV